MGWVFCGGQWGGKYEEGAHPVLSTAHEGMWGGVAFQILMESEGELVGVCLGVWYLLFFLLSSWWSEVGLKHIY